MIVERIQIIDPSNGEAGEYSFSAGANLLVSQKNHQGKSSLLKTMYYGLGLEIKNFPPKWRPSNMIIKIGLLNEKTKQKYYVIRYADLFYVSDHKSALTKAGYTKWLSGELGIDMKLTDKTTGRFRSISYPSALISPFYVDQDDSWSGKFFSSISELQMYSDVPKSIFDYILNITDDKEAKQKEALKQLAIDLKNTKSKRSNVNEVYMDFVNSNTEDRAHDTTAIVNPVTNNKKNLDNFIHLLDEAHKKFIRDKANRLKLQRELDQLKKSLEEYNSILEMLKDDYDYIKSVCKHCNSELTKQQVQTRMDIRTDILEISQLINLATHQLSEVEVKLANALTSEEESNSEYTRLSKEIDTDTEINSLVDYIEEVSKKKSQDDFAQIIQDLDTMIGRLESSVKEKRAEIKEIAKKSEELVERISASYREYVNELSFMMPGSNINIYEFGKFTIPKSSGVNINQIYLGIYLTYMRLVAEYGRYTLPFCIDSFIKNETANQGQQDMFLATEKYLLAMESQSILSIIQENVDKYITAQTNFHRVELGDRLLSSENFKEAYEEVKLIMVSN